MWPSPMKINILPQLISQQCCSGFVSERSSVVGARGAESTYRPQDSGESRLEVMIAFEDLAVYFTWEEWQNMNNAQKTLYRDVMLETYSSLFFLGHCTMKPDLIFKLEQGEEPWMVDECVNQSLSALCYGLGKQ